MKDYSKSAIISANKKLTVAIAILLLIVIAVGVVLGVGFGKYGQDTSKWFKNPQGEIPAEPEIDDNFQLKPQSTKSMRLASGPARLAANGTTVVRVTATALPETAPQEFDWVLSFANPSSAWANGKNVTDYVTVTPTADGANTADVAIVGPFGEQIILNVISRDDTSKKANVTVDYVKRYSFKKWIYDSNGGTRAELNVTDGTIDEELQYSYSLKVKDELWNQYTAAAEAAGIIYKNAFGYESSGTYVHGVSSFDATYQLNGVATKMPFITISGRGTGIILDLNTKIADEKQVYAFFGINNGNVYSSKADKNKVANVLNNAFLPFNAGQKPFTLTFTLNGEHNSVSETVELLSLSHNLPTYVLSVSTDIPSIIF